MMSPRRYRHHRIEKILFVDSIGNLQVLGAVAGATRALWTLGFDPHTWAPRLASVFFLYFPEWAWAIALLVVSGWQYWAAGTQRWQAQLLSASAQIAMLTYSLVVMTLTRSFGDGGLPLTFVFLAMHLHIAMRVEHDREVVETLERQANGA